MVTDTTGKERRKIKNSLLYYGWVSVFGGATNVQQAVQNYSQYDLIVWGNTVQEPAHGDYSNAVQICTGLKSVKPNVEIFGYVPIGLQPAWTLSNLPVAQIKVKIDEWKTLGVTGIFLDEFGYDYYVTRERQNEIVSYVHSLGMNVVVNSWQMEYAFSKRSMPLAWQNNFDGNPNGIEAALKPTDYTMFESAWYLSNDGTTQHVSHKDEWSAEIRMWDAYRYMMEDTPEYGMSYFEKFKTQGFALDAIVSNQPKEVRDKYYIQGLLASTLFGMGAYAGSTEYWGASGTHPSYTFPVLNGLAATQEETIRPSKVGTGYHNSFEKTIGNNVLRLVWTQDAETPSDPTRGTHQLFLNGEAITSIPTTDISSPAGGIAKGGLQYYWNAKDGLKTGNILNNLAPTGLPIDMSITGALYDSPGQYLSFDGLDDTMLFSAPTQLPSLGESWTMELVLTPESITKPFTLFGDYAYASAWVSPGYSDFAVNVYAGLTWESYRGLSAVPPVPEFRSNELMRVAYRFNAQTKVFDLIINNTIVHTETFPGNVAWTSGAGIVRINGNGSGNNFPARFHAFRFYDRNLTDAELTSNWDEGTNLFFSVRALPEVSSLKHSAIASAITLSWTEPSDSNFSHVQILRNGAQVATNITSGSFTDTGLSSNTPYTYLIQVVDTSGNETPGLTETVSTATLPEWEPTGAPYPTVIAVSKHVISDEPDMNATTVTFVFNKDVVAWTANVVGVDPFTGRVADQGGVVPAGEEVHAVIDWTELYQEGENRLNIYGQNTAGQWTPYEAGRYIFGGNYLHLFFDNVLDIGTFTDTQIEDEIRGGKF